MPSLAQSDRFLRLSLISPCSCVSLAAPTLALHLGLTRSEAAARLSISSGTLSDRLEADRAKRLANLLASLGVAVHLDASKSGAPPHGPQNLLFDLSIQPVEACDVEQLAETLPRALPPSLWGDVAPNARHLQHELSGPGGLVFEDQTSNQINQTRRRLRKIKGLRLSASSKATAVYDIFYSPQSVAPISPDILVALRCLGLAPCGLTGAIAARVDVKTRDHIVKRFGSRGLFAFNQDFQRFDLFLMGVQNLSPRELADFLVIRSDLPRAVLERMPCPLKIEAGLTRANALAFQSDYAALGLETCARLRVYHPLMEKTLS